MAIEVEHERPDPSTLARPARGGFGWLLQVLCLVYAAFVIVEDVEQCLWTWPTPLTAQTGSLGEQVGPVDGGFVRVLSVEPDGAVARAGVAVGDRIRFDRPYDNFRRLRAGEAVGFTLVHAGRTSHLQVAAQARRPVTLAGVGALGTIYDMATALAALFGAFIIWRSQRNATTLLLGMALLTYGMVTYRPQFLLSAPLVFPFAFAAGVANLTAIPILFYAFAVRFYRDHVGPTKPWEQGAFWTYAVAAIAVGVGYGASEFYAADFPVIGDSRILGAAVSYVGYAICVGYMVLGWRRSAAAVQQRYALMLVATSAIILSQAVDTLMPRTAPDSLQALHFVANSILTGVLASGLFAYSILRHKVFDLGFAVNRTLVYGVVSAILLAAFGLVEWAVDHFVPIEGREKNALVDAAIALGVFLAFHRVRDVVEHGIEGLFFRRWQKAEADLRRFVREAAFITEGAALMRAFAQALTQFGEGAATAVYLAEGDGYARAAGEVEGAGARLETNLPALVSVRADPKPREIRGGALAGALIAPMINRNDILGVVVLGPKPSGHGWRPDEVELIGWATRQAGLDLHALKVERLEAAQARQAEQISTLRTEVATLRSVIPQRA